jgi:hypothetical protein
MKIPIRVDLPSLGYFFRWTLALLFVISSARAHGENNGLAATPPMGWSSWSTFRNYVNESIIEAQGLAMHHSLQGLGFQYVNVDEGWYLDPSQSVDSYGRWEPDPSLFPDGLSGVAAYMHSIGLKFGMYLTPGIPVAAYNQNTPIQGTSYTARNIVTNTSIYQTNYHFTNVMYYIDYTQPGAQAFINSWADLLASWGVDYVKLDGVGDSTEADVKAWSTALSQCGRPIHLELSAALDINNGATWRQYSNGWRTSLDIEAYGSSTLTNWSIVSGRFSSTPGWQEWGGPGGWSDLDSLEIGNGATDGLTTDERQTTETLWVIAASPLILGTDLTNLDSGDLAQLSNAGVLAINQNGVPGAPVSIGTQEVWRAKQPDGSYAVALFNLDSSSATVSATWASLGFTGAATVYDLWGLTGLGQFASGFSAVLNAHASRFLRVTPQTGAVQYLANSPANTLSGGAITVLQQTATDGVAVGSIGEGGVLQFNNVMASQSGTFNVTILYYDGDSGRSMDVAVDGGAASSNSFAGTGSWNSLGSQTIQVQLQAGSNTIAFSNPNAYAPNVDSITVQFAAPPPPVASFTVNGSSVTVTPGATTGNTSTITVTPSGGFTSSVALTATITSGPVGAQYPPTLSFGSTTPVSITGASVGTATLTISTTPTTMPGTYISAVTGTDVATGKITASTAVTIAVLGFNLSNNGNLSLSPGITTGNSSTITVTPAGGFTGIVNLSCSVTTSLSNPTDLPTCSIPSSVNITGTTTATANLTVNTTASSTAHVPLLRQFFKPAGGIALAFICFFVTPTRRRGWRMMLGMLMFLVTIASGMSACGGGGGTSNPGTTAGTYTVTVTGTASSFTATTTVTVTVN